MIISVCVVPTEQDDFGSCFGDSPHRQDLGTTFTTLLISLLDLALIEYVAAYQSPSLSVHLSVCLQFCNVIPPDNFNSKLDDGNQNFMGLYVAKITTAATMTATADTEVTLQWRVLWQFHGQHQAW